MKKMIGFILCLAGAAPFPARANQGKEGGGGDAYALEFITLANAVSEQLTGAQVVIDGVSPAVFLQKVKALSVVTQDKAVLNGVEVDAINYPSRTRVELNRARWSGYGQDVQRKLYLVFHELVSLMGLDDGRYQISRLYLVQVENFPLANKIGFDSYAFCIGRVAKVHSSSSYSAWATESIKLACNHDNPGCVGRLVALRPTWAPESLRETCANHAHPYCIQMVAKTNTQWHPGILNEACLGETAECVAHVVESKPGWLPSYLIDLCAR